MIKDRGNIKWTTLLLSEHLDALRKFKSLDADREKPVLDEQEIERIGWILLEAAREGEQVKVKYHKDKRFHKAKGVIKKFHTEYITIDNEVIFFSDIVDAVPCC